MEPLSMTLADPIGYADLAPNWIHFCGLATHQAINFGTQFVEVVHLQIDTGKADIGHLIGLGSRSRTKLPMILLGTSERPRLWSASSICTTMCSMASLLTGRLVAAIWMPESNFCRS